MNELLLWLGLATILISGDTELTDAQIHKISPHIIYSATAHEALDYNQWYNHFTSPICLQSDLDGIRMKMNNLPNLPRRAGINEWGTTREELLKYMEANRQFHNYLDHLKGLGVMWDHQLLQDVIDENGRLYNAIDWLQYVEAQHQSRYNQRTSLARVRDLIGREAFDRRLTIPFLPYWRFRQIP